jgi:hypothetical protein
MFCFMAGKGLSGLSVRTVIPGTLRYLTEVSKGEASFWRKETAKRHAINQYTSPSMLWLLRSDWNHLEQIYPLALELSTVSASREVREAWSCTMVQLRGVPGVDVTTPIHTKIALLHESGIVTDLPARNNIVSLVFPRTTSTPTVPCPSFTSWMQSVPIGTTLETS